MPATESLAPGHLDVIIAHQGSIRFLTSALAHVCVDFELYKEAHPAVSGEVCPNRVFYLTLRRVLSGFLVDQRRSHVTRVNRFHGNIAMAVIAGADWILAPDVPVLQWRRVSPHTVTAMRLGQHMTSLARKAVMYGRRMVPVGEQWTTKPCCHCMHCEARGSKLFLICTNCGMATLRDLGAAPTNIMRRFWYHAEETLLGMEAVARS